MLIATEAIHQKSGLTLFVGLVFLFVDWVLGGWRASVARGAPVTVAQQHIIERQDNFFMYPNGNTYNSKLKERETKRKQKKTT